MSDLLQSSHNGYYFQQQAYDVSTEHQQNPLETIFSKQNEGQTNNRQTLKVHQFDNNPLSQINFNKNDNSISMLNFDYSSMFDNKNGINEQFDIAISGANGIFQPPKNMDESMLSSNSDNPLTNSNYTYKSQGMKQLLMQQNQINLSNIYSQPETSQPQKTQADMLIEQSKKRIQDITELMKPPSEMINSYLKKDQTSTLPASIMSSTQNKLDLSQASVSDLSQKNVMIQKSTKVMENELKSLQDKIMDLETKLSITNQSSNALSFENYYKNTNNIKNDKARNASVSSQQSNDNFKPTQQCSDSIQDNKPRRKMKIDINLNNMSCNTQVEGDFTVDDTTFKAKSNFSPQSVKDNFKSKKPLIKNSDKLKNRKGPVVKQAGISQTPQRRLSQERSSRLNNQKVTSSSATRNIQRKTTSVNRFQSTQHDPKKATLNKDILTQRSKENSTILKHQSSNSKSRPQTANTLAFKKTQQTPLNDITNKEVNVKKQTQQEESVHSNYKEIASKVVDLQRQIMQLRSKLKMKEQVEEENEKLKQELNEMRLKNVEVEKKKKKYKEQAKELQALVSTLQKDNKGLKEEIGDLVFGNGKGKDPSKKKLTNKKKQ